MGDPFLKIDNLSKVYGEDTRRFRDIFLFLHAGETFGRLGANGCGQKQRFLRIIAGLEVPDAGRVVVEGMDMTHCLPAERDVALVLSKFFTLSQQGPCARTSNFRYEPPGATSPKQKSPTAFPILQTCSASRRFSTGPPRTCRAAKCSALPLVAPSCANPDFFCSTSPSPIWMPSCAKCLRVELIRLQRDLGHAHDLRDPRPG